VNDVQDDAEPASNQTPPADERPASQESQEQQFRLRRAPRYRSFGITGVGIGVIVGLILAFSRPANDDYSAQTIAGYFAASFGLIGALIGLGAAVFAERRRKRRGSARR
jgi:hypothetical protein